MSDRPGVMLYFSEWNRLINMNDHTVAKFIRAVFNYAQNGEWPNFEDMEAAMWGMVASKIDNDAIRYEETKKSRCYARYCGIQKKRGENLLDEEEWEERIYRPKQTSTNVDFCDHLHIQHQLQNQSQPQIQSHFQQQVQGDVKGETNYLALSEDEFEKERQRKQDQLTQILNRN